MVFSSLVFTFIFLPTVILLNYVAKDRYRNYILLLASLMFYSYGEPKFVFVMIALIAVNYGMALAIARVKEESRNCFARNLLIISVCGNIGILFIYKYLDFALHTFNQVFHTEFRGFNIALPIGLSFFTFQALSYVVDVYRGTVKVQKNPICVALYISFFPQLVAGPIVRYSTIESQINHRDCTLEGFAEGGRRFMLGFAKKVLLANNLSVIATEVFSLDATVANPLVLWMGSICYSLQIFYDFSGYSDMAIGLGRIFGFTFWENFNYPYISKSVTEFWRRWHMSLGQWFRDYVYIPLGGSRVSVPRHIVNMFIVWLLTGIWHGANYTFIIWGLWYFILLVVEKYIVKPERIKSFILANLWRIVTLIAVNFGWVMFNSANWWKGLRFCLAMVGGYGNGFAVDDFLIRYCREYGFFVCIAVVFSTPIAKVVKRKIENSKIEKVCALAVPFAGVILFLWAISYIILGVHNPFIYFNF